MENRPDKKISSRQVAKSFKFPGEPPGDGHYLLYQPEDEEQKNQEGWPLLIFLHGAGERGDNLEKLKTHGPPKMIAQGHDFPCFVASPQCPEGEWWSNRSRWLEGFLDHLLSALPVDRSRVYLTGISMGGFGTWTLGCLRPESFAALVPICGGGNPVLASTSLKDMPVWVFHGAKDTLVEPGASQEMVDALVVVGGNVKFTLYPDVGHCSWNRAYRDPLLWEWLFSQKRTDVNDK